jgi:hypothetical protein
MCHHRARDPVNPLACALTLSFAVGLGGGQSGVPPFETIMQDDALLLHRPDREVRRTVARMRDLGVDRVRITAGWSAIAPEPERRRRPAFEARDPRDYPKGAWSSLDRAIREVTRAGMQAMIDVAFFAPRWAVRREGPRGRHRLGPSAHEFGQFAEAVARRYSGRFGEGRATLPAVRLYTTWNEPNHPTFLLPQWERGRGRAWRPASPHLYRRLHESAYAAIKRVSAENRVLIGGLASKGSRRRGHREGMPPLRFLRELACLDGRLQPLRGGACRGFQPLRADGFAIHPYTEGGAPGVPDDERDSLELADLGRLERLLGELGRRGRIPASLPIHVTEYGYETNPPDPHGVPLGQQAEYLAQATYLAWRRPEVRSFAQFLLQDIGPDPGEPAGSSRRWDDYQTGLIDPEGRPKPALQAFRLPLWAERAIGVGGEPGIFVFGQVRPGSGRRHVQVQARGPRGAWRAYPSLPLGVTGAGCLQFATDRHGFVLRFLPLAPPGSYRLVWTRSPGRHELSAPVHVGADAVRPVPELARRPG